MTDKITCPVCGKQVTEYRSMDLSVECTTGTCLLNGIMYIHGVSTETALRARITELENNPAWRINSGLRKENDVLLNRALNAEANVIELEAENEALKARCTWKRALKVTPPLDTIVIVLSTYMGAMRAEFLIHKEKLYFHKPNDDYCFLAGEDTLWIDMPEAPEVQP